MVASCLAAMTLALPCTLLDARQFTEKDGGRTLEGRVESVNPAQGTVTLRLAGNRTVTFKHEILVEEDVEYIMEWTRKSALANSVSLSANRENGQRGVRKVGETYEYRTEEAGYRIAVRNTANAGTLDEVPVNWHIVITRADGNTEVVSGSETVKFLAAGTTKEVSTGMVSLETSCKSISSCPQCVDHAKSFRGDRLEGIVVEIVNDDDEAIKDIVVPSNRERQIRQALEPAAEDTAS